ncbi:hypothetical protein U3516DRAFT_658481 [Neocallimastix sp. 'constans']
MGKSIISSYIEKQKQFISQVKSIQHDIINKEYKKHGCSFNDYVKSKWNISKAQAYRYLISAKVLDQLKEYDILPNYERLCRTINSITETPQQIKLLWGIIIKRYRNSPDNINSSMITKVWKELCMDKKYSNVCHIESGFSDKIERTLGDYSRRIKSKQLNSKTAKTNQNVNNIKNNVSPNIPTTIISPISINDNSIPSPVPTIVSPTITVPENTVSYKNNFSSQNNIQLATITTTAPTNEICYIPTYQPQYVFCNDQNQVQNIIIY